MAEFSLQIPVPHPAYAAFWDCDCFHDLSALFTARTVGHFSGYRFGSEVLGLHDHFVEYSVFGFHSDYIIWCQFHKSSSNKTLDRMRRATSFVFSGITDRRIGQLVVRQML